MEKTLAELKEENQKLKTVLKLIQNVINTPGTVDILSDTREIIE